MLGEAIGAEHHVARSEVVATGPRVRSALCEDDRRDGGVFDATQPVGVASEEEVEHLHREQAAVRAAREI